MNRSSSFILACATSTLLSATATAQTTPDQVVSTGSEVDRPTVLSTNDAGQGPPAAVTPAAPGLFDTGPIGEAVLVRVSGREDRLTWQASNAQSSATVRDNTVGDNSPTGALAVSDSAFQNVSGISMVNLNTGNASSINATMNVNLSIQMAPAAPGGR